MTDRLTPLIAAYRAENPPSAVDARALRTRILQAAARRDQSPARHLKWLVPVAATFLGSVALAATPVGRPFVTHLWSHLTALGAPDVLQHAAAARPAPLSAAPALTLAPHPDLPEGATPAASPVGPVATRPDRAPSIAAQPPAPARVHAGTAGPSGRELATRASAGTAARAELAPPAFTADPEPSVAAAPPPPLPPPVAPLAADLAAYQVAHRLHFASADYARALRAWDGYLERFPNGTFAPEARLNRGVCLARLGRTREARAQLRPMANDQAGSYATQARRLLEAMGGSD